MNPEKKKIPIEQITEEKKNELLTEYQDTISDISPVTGKPKRQYKKRQTQAEALPVPAPPAIDKASMERMQLAVVKLTGMGLDWLAPRMPKEIETTNLEKQMIGEPLAEVLIEFIPNLESNFKYIALLTGAAFWLGPRMEGYVPGGKNKKRDSDIRKNGEGEINVSKEAPRKIETEHNAGPPA